MTRRQSSSSAGVVWLDRESRISELREAVHRAARKLPLRRAVLFGSLAGGNATARSDADLLLVVSESSHRHPRDRIPEALEALRPLPCPVDLTVLTDREARQAHRRGSAFMEAVESGIQLWP